MLVVIMGVSGSGKSTVGTFLASKLGWKFYDADDYHPDENKAKMAKGIPLDDQDRIPWLCFLHDLIMRSTPISSETYGKPSPGRYGPRGSTGSADTIAARASTEPGE
ncbi:putative gluconokinase isoform X5 [Lissotriton helveticus]